MALALGIAVQDASAAMMASRITPEAYTIAGPIAREQTIGPDFFAKISVIR